LGSSIHRLDVLYQLIRIMWVGVGQRDDVTNILNFSVLLMQIWDIIYLLSGD
jgi:hypothetical protein